MFGPFAKIAARAELHRRNNRGVSWLRSWKLALEVPFERQRQYALAGEVIRRYDLEGARLHFVSASGNLVFRVEHPRGNFALRIGAPGARNLEQVRAELAFAEALRKDLGVGTAEVVRGRDGELVQVYGDADGASRMVVLFTWVQGRPLDHRPSIVDMELVGRLQARMHAFTLAEGRSYERGRPMLRAEDAMDQIRLPEKARTAFADRDQRMVKEMGDFLQEMVPVIFQRSPAALVHFDLQGGNVLVDGDDLGILDLDDCMVAPIVLDMATSLAYSTVLPNAADLRAAFLRGHAAAGDMAAEHVELLDPAIALIAYREIKRVLDWPLITTRPWGPQVLAESLKVVRGVATSMGVMR